jgi:hypothetical protein
MKKESNIKLLQRYYPKFYEELKHGVDAIYSTRERKYAVFKNKQIDFDKFDITSSYVIYYNTVYNDELGVDKSSVYTGITLINEEDTYYKIINNKVINEKGI